MSAVYHLCDTADPEERLEDAALFKAMYDAFGGALASDVGHTPATVEYGREVRFKPRRTQDIAYWDDPAFLRACGRKFVTCCWEEADRHIADLHAAGMGAFVKSTRAKHFICRVPIGSDLATEADGMAYSFIDGGPLIMVQEEVRMRYEHRFFVVCREIVTHSPNAAHLTPIDYPQPFAFETPQHTTPTDRSWWEMMSGVVKDIASDMRVPDAVVDMAIVNGRPICVEINPLAIGGVGLFACNVRALAKAIYDRDKHLLPP